MTKDPESKSNKEFFHEMKMNHINAFALEFKICVIIKVSYQIAT